MTLGFGLLLLTIALTLVGANVTAWLQHRTWMYQQRLKAQEEELIKAKNLVDTIAKLTDERLYRQRRLLWAIKSGSADIEESRRLYVNSLFDWNDNLGYIKSNIMFLFGRYEMNTFEETVHNGFQHIGSIIEGVMKGRLPKSELVKVENDLNRQGRVNYEYAHSLMEDVRNGSLPSFPDSSYVSFGNRENLSSIYLIQRLFGAVE